jgi:hypothetical protein
MIQDFEELRRRLTSQSRTLKLGLMMADRDGILIPKTAAVNFWETDWRMSHPQMWKVKKMEGYSGT